MSRVWSRGSSVMQSARTSWDSTSDDSVGVNERSEELQSVGEVQWDPVLARQQWRGSDADDSVESHAQGRWEESGDDSDRSGLVVGSDVEVETSESSMGGPIGRIPEFVARGQPVQYYDRGAFRL